MAAAQNSVGTDMTTKLNNFGSTHKDLVWWSACFIIHWSTFIWSCLQNRILFLIHSIEVDAKSHSRSLQRWNRLQHHCWLFFLVYCGPVLQRGVDLAYSHSKRGRPEGQSSASTSMTMTWNIYFGIYNALLSNLNGFDMRDYISGYCPFHISNQGVYLVNFFSASTTWQWNADSTTTSFSSPFSLFYEFFSALVPLALTGARELWSARGHGRDSFALCVRSIVLHTQVNGKSPWIERRINCKMCFFVHIDRSRWWSNHYTPRS